MMMVVVVVDLERMGLDVNPLKLHLIEVSKDFDIHFGNFGNFGNFGEFVGYFGEFVGYFDDNLVCFGYQHEIMTYCRYFDYYLCSQREM
jgi:hypothetical protein